VATRERVAELERLFASLETQVYRDFEVILIDQNSDERLTPVIEHHRNLNVRYVRCTPGASKARNEGLRLAQGDIIAFPDDDCWYPEHLLKNVVDWFASHPEYGGLFGMLRDADGTPVGPRWPDVPCACDRSTLWDRGITPIGFLRRSVTELIGFFDERLGPGAVSGYYSGEDIDFFLRPLEHNIRMWHDPGFVVHHPSFHAPDRLRQKTYSYSKGGGYVMRAHGYPPRLFLRGMIRSLGGAVVAGARFDFFQSRMYAARAAGLFRGYVCGSRDLQKAAQAAQH
jgi:glycosyltransferase involved in cell wall biosynthesis